MVSATHQIKCEHFYFMLKDLHELLQVIVNTIICLTHYLNPTRSTVQHLHPLPLSQGFLSMLQSIIAPFTSHYVPISPLSHIQLHQRAFPNSLSLAYMLTHILFKSFLLKLALPKATKALS